MKKYNFFYRFVSGLIVNPILLLGIKHKRFWMFLLCWILLPISFFTLIFLHNWFFSEGGVRKVYYFATYDPNKIRVVEDNDFRFYEKGYSCSYRLESEYYIAHRILLIPETKSVPIGYEYNGKVLVEIFANEQLVKSFHTNEVKNILREGEEDFYGDYLIYRGKNTSFTTSVFAFELGNIPFSIFKENRKENGNIRINFTVINPDGMLLDYCDRAILVIIPDLIL